MEKFYVINNQKYLDELSNYRKADRIRNAFIKEFYESHNIEGKSYYMGGNGRVNCAFSEFNKTDISLYIPDNEKNVEQFGKMLKVPRRDGRFDGLRELKKKSPLLKEFQEECIKKQIVINLWYPRTGDYFHEIQYGGYKRTTFELNGITYLSINADVDSLTPKEEGFTEIKGSEFYKALEAAEEV